MAYDDSQVQGTDDEQERSAGQVGGNPVTQLSGGGGGFAGQSSTAGTSSAGAAPGTGAPAGPNAPGTPTTSGQWTNLSDYLNANSSQSAGMGQNLANTVQGQAQTAENDLGSVITGFQNQTPYTNINATTQSDVDNAITNPGQYAPTTTNGVTTPADTTNAELYLNGGNSSGAGWGITPGVNDITEFAPTSGPSWGTVQNDYTNAGQSLQDTQSESGRDVLLQNQYGQNGAQYTPGEQNFDQLLLQQNPGNAQALNSVYNQYAPNEVVPQATTGTSSAANTANAANAAGLPLDVYNALTNSQNYATNEETQAQNIENQAQTDLTNDISGLGTSVSGEIGNDSGAYQTNYNALSSALAAGDLTPAQVAQLGLATGQINTYGVNPSQYLSEVSNPFTGAGSADAAATSQDWSNYEGLNALLTGLQGTPQATDQSELQSIGLTGTSMPSPAQTNPADFNLGGFTSAVTNAQNELPQQIAALYSQTEASRAKAGGFSDYGNASASNFNPSTDSFTLSTPGMAGQTFTQTVSLDPTSPNYIGGNSGIYGSESGWSPTANAWQQLLATLNDGIDKTSTTGATG